MCGEHTSGHSVCSPHTVISVCRSPVDRQVMFEHLKHLGEQLKMEEKPPLVLHLSVTILALNLSQRMIHIPGRLVPIVMSHLESVMDSSKYMVLKTFQGDCFIRYLLDVLFAVSDHKLTSMV